METFKWKRLWRINAEKFVLEPLSYEGEGFSLAEAMKDKGPVRDAIINENKHPLFAANDITLQQPTSSHRLRLKEMS
jgi:hypothetical protein